MNQAKGEIVICSVRLNLSRRHCDEQVSMMNLNCEKKYGTIVRTNDDFVSGQKVPSCVWPVVLSRVRTMESSAVKTTVLVCTVNGAVPALLKSVLLAPMCAIKYSIFVIFKQLCLRF